jgi:hypothetical protein
VYVGQVPNLDELPADERAAMEANMRRVYGVNPIGRLWFDTMKPGLSDWVVRRVERLL